mmetsp:Transcript_2033/g.9204  ORF Transcript_2033/g.9204 Transcript_2033/m.9204 type:complete len:231 (+) Transcript_2033:1087-1779(+)
MNDESYAVSQRLVGFLDERLLGFWRKRGPSQQLCHVLVQAPRHRLLQRPPEYPRERSDPQRAHPLLGHDLDERRGRSTQLHPRAQHIRRVRQERGDAARDRAGEEGVHRVGLPALRHRHLAHHRPHLRVHHQVEARERRVPQQRRAESREQSLHSLLRADGVQGVGHPRVRGAADRRVLHPSLDHREGAEHGRGQGPGRGTDGEGPRALHGLGGILRHGELRVELPRHPL